MPPSGSARSAATVNVEHRAVAGSSNGQSRSLSTGVCQGAAGAGVVGGVVAGALFEAGAAVATVADHAVVDTGAVVEAPTSSSSSEHTLSSTHATAEPRRPASRSLLVRVAVPFV